MLKSETTAGVGEFVVGKSFSPRSISFVYSGMITESGIATLAEYVDMAFSLYQPDDVTVQMKSPGGLIVALEYWVYKLQQWRGRGRNIATQAGIECASAAAMLVTLGAVGKRSAHPLAKLLFHNPRLVSRDLTMLEQDAEAVARALKDSRARMYGMLEQHLINSLGLLEFARTLSARAEWLLNENRALEGVYFWRHIAQGYSLECLMTPLASWAEVPLDTHEDAEALLAQWKVQIDTLFRKDQVIDLRVAWALLLIDMSDELPPVFGNSASPHDDEKLVEFSRHGCQQTFRSFYSV